MAVVSKANHLLQQMAGRPCRLSDPSSKTPRAEHAPLRGSLPAAPRIGLSTGIPRV